MIEIIRNDFSIPELNEKLLQVHVSNLIENEELSEGELIFVLLKDDELLAYNKELLDHDYFTDIITVDQRVGDIISGELLISIDRIKDNASELKIDFLEELHRVFFHGILHIIGYGDKSEKEIEMMRSKENFYLSKVSF